MPKVDPDSGDMLSDDPDLASDSERGGKSGADAPKGANPTGSDGATQQGQGHDTSEGPTSGD